MLKKIIRLVPALLLAGFVAVAADTPKNAYPTMPPLDQYMTADVKAEIAFARSAAVRNSGIKKPCLRSVTTQPRLEVFSLSTF